MSYASTVLADSPTFYWRLGETSGTTAADASGNGNTATYSVSAASMTAAGLLTGDTDTAAAISDPTHYVKSPVGASYFASGFSTFTFEIIIKVTAFGTNGQFFGSVTANPFFACQADGSWAFNSSFLTLTGPSPLSTGTTYHLCATYDGTTAILYLNGVSVDSTVVSGSEPAGPTDYWEVGYDADTGSGTYDEAAFYTHALTPARVAAHVAAMTSGTSMTGLPQVIINVDTPSIAATRGHLVFDDATYGKFNTAAFAPSAVYVDKIADTRSWSTSRGSSDLSAALFHANTGTANVQFNNLARTYDPLSNPDIRPRRGLQIQAVWNAVTYTLFTGFVDEWNLAYPEYAHDATADAAGLDGTSLLVDAQLTEPLERALTGTRISELLDLTEWPASLRSLSVGATTMPASLKTESGLQAMIEAADSEMGELYVETDGTMTFRDRTAIITETRSKTSQATFGDGVGEIPYSSVAISYDAQRIRNDIAVAYNEQGDVAYASDAISINRYGRKAYQLQVSIDDATTANGLAAFLLKLYKDPLVRVDGVTFKPRNLTSAGVLWPQVLGRKLSDRVTVKVTPPGGGSRISREVFVRGITHDFGQDSDWTTTFGFQDASSYGSFFVFDTSMFDGTSTLWF